MKNIKNIFVILCFDYVTTYIHNNCRCNDTIDSCQCDNSDRLCRPGVVGRKQGRKKIDDCFHRFDFSPTRLTVPRTSQLCQVSPPTMRSCRVQLARPQSRLPVFSLGVGFKHLRTYGKHCHHLLIGSTKPFSAHHVLAAPGEIFYSLQTCSGKSWPMTAIEHLQLNCVTRCAISCVLCGPEHRVNGPA